MIIHNIDYEITSSLFLFFIVYRLQGSLCISASQIYLYIQASWKKNIISITPHGGKEPTFCCRVKK